MKGIIGILGGMGPEATVDAFSRLIKTTPANNDQQHIPVIITSLADTPDRSACILHDGASPYPRMLQALHILQNAGVSCIVIACNTAHYWFEELKQQTTIPMISIIEVTCNKVAQDNISKVALLATTATVHARMYQSRLASQQIECIAPSVQNQQLVMDSIFLLKAGDLVQARVLMLRVVSDMLNQGVEKIILGCTEIPIILQNEMNKQPEHYINATQELINSVVDWYYQ